MELFLIVIMWLFLVLTLICYVTLYIPKFRNTDFGKIVVEGFQRTYDKIEESEISKEGAGKILLFIGVILSTLTILMYFINVNLSIHLSIVSFIYIVATILTVEKFATLFSNSKSHKEIKFNKLEFNKLYLDFMKEEGIDENILNKISDLKNKFEKNIVEHIHNKPMKKGESNG